MYVRRTKFNEHVQSLHALFALGSGQRTHERYGVRDGGKKTKHVNLK